MDLQKTSTLWFDVVWFMILLPNQYFPMNSSLKLNFNKLKGESSGFMGGWNYNTE